ncbi:MAG: Gfo/Idh/MocA family oxidoreductase [Phycisphaerales bacterium]|jgi:predicted dehydrogenase|nr:Gfo/Idh/MocA family oxidoreductase [Phycisphaerales bacterium]
MTTNPTTTTRRRFLKGAAGSAAAAMLAGMSGPVWAKPIGANNDIRIAIVGLNAHGTGDHLNKYLRMPGVRVVALCDPDQNVLDRSVKRVGKATPNIRTFTDIRKLLAEKDIDAISGATPNHWHALSTVWACQAGKHVCVEKPVSHNIWEGRKMVQAAAKYNRMVQADLDKRSNNALARTVDYIQGGELGKILLVHSWVYKRRGSMGKVGAAGGKIPSSIDYDLWCGPAPKGPLPRKRLHYDWHWQWDTGNGEIGNNGPHHLDACRWAMGEKGLPKSVITFGGRYGYDDDGQTPNTHITLFEYDSAPILFEVRGLPRKTGSKLMDPYNATSRKGMKLQRNHNSGSPNNGEIVVCENGFVDLGSCTVFDRQGKKVKTFTASSLNAKENFIKALRSGKQSDLKTTMLNGHLSTSLCHMGNISYRVGKAATLEQTNDLIGKDQQVLDAVERTRQHLSANGVDLKTTGLTLGPKLTMDSAAEQFTGQFAKPANELVKRKYRKPFVIPEKV